MGFLVALNTIAWGLGTPTPIMENTQTKAELFLECPLYIAYIFNGSKAWILGVKFVICQHFNVQTFWPMSVDEHTHQMLTCCERRRKLYHDSFNEGLCRRAPATLGLLIISTLPNSSCPCQTVEIYTIGFF